MVLDQYLDSQKLHGSSDKPFDRNETVHDFFPGFSIIKMECLLIKLSLLKVSGQDFLLHTKLESHLSIPIVNLSSKTMNRLSSQLSKPHSLQVFPLILRPETDMQKGHIIWMICLNTMSICFHFLLRVFCLYIQNSLIQGMTYNLFETSVGLL